MFRHWVLEPIQALFSGPKQHPLFETFQLEERFQKKQKLGSGAFGVVFLATDKNSGKDVAIKEIKLNSTNTKMIEREVLYLSNMHHENIAEMIVAFKQPSNAPVVFIAMENCSGGELFDAIIKKDHLTEGIAKQVTYEILSAIQYCHSRNIAHLDIKPENVLLSRPWIEQFPPIKLVDFGLAKPLGNSSTCPPHVGGTLTYMAPEALKGCYSDKTDLWSIGVVLWTMLTGSLPFDGRNHREMLQNIRGGLVWYQHDWHDVSQDCARFMSDLMSREYQRPDINTALRDSWFNSNVDTVRPEVVLTRLRHYTHQNKLKRYILHDIVRNLTLRETQDVARIFKKQAGDRTSLPFEEVRRCILNYIDVRVGPQLIHQIQALDLNNDNMVDLHEFVVAMLAANIVTRDLIAQFYNDHDMKRELTISYLRQFFKDEEQSVKIINDIDKDHNGTITIEEFVEYMLKDD